MSKTLIKVPLNQISADEANVRTSMDDKALLELAQSIKAVGILEPPLVRDGDKAGHYVLVAGARRIAAARLANDKLGASITSVDVIYDSEAMDAQSVTVAMLVENLQREDISPIDEAQGYLRLTTAHGWKQVDIADTVGRNKSHISRRLRLLELPVDLQGDLVEGRFTIEDALDLVTLPSATQHEIREGGYRPHAIDAAVREVERQKQAERKRKDIQAKYPGLVVVAGRSDVSLEDDQALEATDSFDFVEDKLPKGTTVITCSGGTWCYGYKIVPKADEPESTSETGATAKAEAPVIDHAKVERAVDRERTAHEDAILADIAMRPKVAWFKDLAIEAGVKAACSQAIAGRVCRILELEPIQTEQKVWSEAEKKDVAKMRNDYPLTVKRWAENDPKAATQVAILGWRLGKSWDASEAIAAHDKELNFEVFKAEAVRKTIVADLEAKAAKAKPAE